MGKRTTEISRLATGRLFQTPQALFKNGWANGLGFVEVTFCDIGHSEISDNFVSNCTIYHTTPVPLH